MADLTITAASVVAGSNASKREALASVTITAGQAVYVVDATKKLALADSDSATAEVRRADGIALNSAAVNQPVSYQISGDITIGATLTAGATYFLSNTPGGICPDADVGAAEYVCQLGIAKSTTVLAMSIQYPNVARS